jgi:hypothetical protein
MRRKSEAKERMKRILIIATAIIFIGSSIAYVVLFRSDSSTNTNIQTLTLGGRTYNFEQKLDEFNNPYYFVSDKTDQFYVYYLPQQLSNIMDNETQNYLKSMNYFYLTFYPSDTNIQFIDYLRFDLRKNLPASVYFLDTAIEPSSKYNLPIATCNNATAGSPVVMLESANSTNISLKGSCIIMNYAQYDSLRIRDSFVYLLRGIPLK